MMFDDQVIDPIPSPKTTTLLQDFIPGVQVNDWRFTIIADGMLPALTGVEALPFGNAYHYTHEAALHFFKLRTTSLKTDGAIGALRTQFLQRLRDDFGIDINPEDYDDIPLDGEIDLGGGNQILAYVVNEATRQRVITKTSPSQTEQMLPGAHLHEGGFRLRVGRSGIMTRNGRVPFGTIFNEGVYILEDNLTSENLEINFYSLNPILLDAWSTFVIRQHLDHPSLGEGMYQAVNPLVMDAKQDGVQLRYHGVMSFGIDAAAAGAK